MTLYSLFLPLSRSSMRSLHSQSRSSSSCLANLSPRGRCFQWGSSISEILWLGIIFGLLWSSPLWAINDQSGWSENQNILPHDDHELPSYKGTMVRIGLNLTPYRKVSVGRGGGGGSQFNYLPAGTLRRTLRARIDKPNHFYIDGYHIETVPLRWVRPKREYTIRLSFAHRPNRSRSGVEKHLGYVDVRGHLKQSTPDVYLLIGANHKTFFNNLSEPFLRAVVGYGRVGVPSIPLARQKLQRRRQRPADSMPRSPRIAVGNPRNHQSSSSQRGFKAQGRPSALNPRAVNQGLPSMMPSEGQRTTQPQRPRSSSVMKASSQVPPQVPPSQVSRRKASGNRNNALRPQRPAHRHQPRSARSRVQQPSPAPLVPPGLQMSASSYSSSGRAPRSTSALQRDQGRGDSTTRVRANHQNLSPRR